MTQNSTRDDDRTCSYENCNGTSEMMIRTGGRLYCRHDHSSAGRNGWGPEELEPWHVEYDGFETVYLAPTEESAQRQWRCHVQAADNPHRTQPRSDGGV